MNKYARTIHSIEGHGVCTVDVYSVLDAFKVTCPATQHAVKKLLLAGQRGHKDLAADLNEAIEAIERAKQIAMVGEQLESGEAS